MLVFVHCDKSVSMIGARQEAASQAVVNYHQVRRIAQCFSCCLTCEISQQKSISAAQTLYQILTFCERKLFMFPLEMLHDEVLRGEDVRLTESAN